MAGPREGLSAGGRAKGRQGKAMLSGQVPKQRTSAPGEAPPNVMPTRRASRPRRMRELLWLVLVGVGVIVVVVLGVWLSTLDYPW